MILLHLIAIACLLASGEEHRVWKCTNKDTLEVICTSSRCESQPSFTPIQLEIASDRISICAYSACFDGAADLYAHKGNHLLFSGTPNQDSNPTISPPERLSLTLDQESGAAVLIWRGFAHAVRCT